MSDPIPETQWAITCPVEGKIQIKKIPVPQPGPGEVLIKCFASPLNPSDLGLMSGIYSEHKLFDITYPTVPGWEGAGLVVASGGGYMAWSVQGYRVAFIRKVEKPSNAFVLGGTYQQYVIADALTCIPLADNVSYDVGSMFFVNPLTAILLVKRVTTLGQNACIQTAACSQLGRMVV